jgi:hypothetical protein
MLATGLLTLRPFALFTLLTLFTQGASLSSFSILLGPIGLTGVVLTWTGLTALTISWRAAGRKETCCAWIR